jgi:DNA-binding IscR family transcriptional regulator
MDGGSINVNPVIVRKEISVLREAGLLQADKEKKGKPACKNAEIITISEIYKAVKNTEVLGRKIRILILPVV